MAHTAAGPGAPAPPAARGGTTRGRSSTLRARAEITTVETVQRTSKPAYKVRATSQELRHRHLLHSPPRTPTRSTSISARTSLQEATEFLLQLSLRPILKLSLRPILKLSLPPTL